MLANSEFTVRHQCDITMEVHSLGRALPLPFRARYNRMNTRCYSELTPDADGWGRDGDKCLGSGSLETLAGAAKFEVMLDYKG